MNTKPEFHDEADLTARSAKKEWAEPQIVLERPLEARADDAPIMFPTPTGRRINPLGTSSQGGGCI
jgi:hypothetical protein